MDAESEPWGLAQTQVQSSSPFVPGEITVGVGADFVLAADNQAFGLVLLDAFPMMAEINAAQSDASSLAAQTLLLRTMPGAELAEIERLAGLPGVLFALPNWTARAAFTEPSLPVTDPLYATEQWAAQRILATRGWALAQAQAGSLDRLTHVRVAVLDSGIDFAHPELAGRLLPGWDYVEPGTAPQDEYGHGTHMTGLIAASFNNGRGMVGLAPAVEILPYRVLDAEGGGGMTNIATAIRAAANSNARIINLSLFLDASHPLLLDAVRYAQSRGALLVASAGNCVLGQPCPVPVGYPAAYPEVLAVGASTLYDARAYYSATGAELDLLAPGGDTAARILSLWPADRSLKCGEQNFRLIGNDAYCYAVGTSSAAALVSGAAALLLSVQPDLSAADVRAILLETAHHLPFAADQVGAGRLDLRAAMRYITPGDLMASPARVLHTLIVPSAVTTSTAVSASARIDAGGDLGQGTLSAQTLAPVTLAPPPVPVTRTVLIENPGLLPVTWTATLAGGGDWARLVGPTAGLARFEAPGQLTLVISPTAAMVGRFEAGIQLEGTRSDGSHVLQTVPVRLDIHGPHMNNVYLPRTVARPRAGLPVAVPFAWAMPATPDARTVYGLTDNSSGSVPLPFAVTVLGRTFTDFRLVSDGYISLPGGENEPGAVNTCLANLVRPSHVIAGWWGDLNPGAPQSRISTFITPASDSSAGSLVGNFVVEYLNVPLRGQPDLWVSFQIVLLRNGGVQLNYLDTPDFAARHIAQPDATVGIAAQYGRFYRQLYCQHDQVQMGSLPGSRQSFQFDMADFD
ncbi:MAG: S8 family serine peptidase [Litorilinea sp.]